MGKTKPRKKRRSKLILLWCEDCHIPVKGDKRFTEGEVTDESGSVVLDLKRDRVAADRGTCPACGRGVMAPAGGTKLKQGARA